MEVEEETETAENAALTVRVTGVVADGEEAVADKKMCPEHPNWPKDECVWCGAPRKIAFYTTKDKLFHFVDNKNFSKPIEIRGKGHWKRELKKRGLTDDKGIKPKKKSKEESRKEYKKVVGEAYKESRRINL